jgi:trehalose synthase
VLGDEEYERLHELTVRAREALAGRVVFNVSSTAVGGGVVELLRSLIGYTRGAGVDARWKVITAGPEFFEVTKRIHNRLHGYDGDGGELGDVERRIYEGALAANEAELVRLVAPGDVVLLHDPQTAGLTRAVKARGAHVVWRAHIGLDLPNDLAREAWDFLRPYVADADAYVFSRGAFVWDGLPAARTHIISPSIDAFAPKNQELSGEHTLAILEAIGLLTDGVARPPTFTYLDGTPGRVDHPAEILQVAPLRPDDRFVLQVSRWDALKDHAGVMHAFAAHVAPASDAHLVLAGPASGAVADDPEGQAVWQQLAGAWSALDDATRARVHVVSLPMTDVDENAVMVNALQRRATIVAQKSLAEGFGLTVAEAMWKGAPVVASRIGGIQDQIEDGVSGVLVDDPADLAAFGAALVALLADPARAERVGANAKERVRARFLGARHLHQYFEVVAALIAEPVRA